MRLNFGSIVLKTLPKVLFRTEDIAKPDRVCSDWKLRLKSTMKSEARLVCKNGCGELRRSRVLCWSVAAWSSGNND